jgi:trk system potassium uptake protein TrkA
LKVVFVGAGEVGYHVIDALYREGVDIVAVDNNSAVLERLREDYAITTVLGNATDSATLDSVDLQHVDLFLAVTDSDETNIIACLMAHDAGAGTKIARVKTIDLGLKTAVTEERFFGIDLVINPYEVAAEHLEYLVQYPQITDVHTFLSDRMMLLRVLIHDGSPLANKRVRDIGPQFQIPGSLLALILRGGEHIIPNGDAEIHPGDHVYFFAERTRLKKLFRLMHLSANPAHRVYINGGGHIGYALARRLELTGMDVRILEINEDRCDFLSEHLDHALVLNMDGSDVNSLKQEGVESADMFISLTAEDDINLMSCMLARTRGAKRTVALVKEQDYIPMLMQNGCVDIAFSPRRLTGRKILRFVRGKDVNSFFSFPNSDVELLEMEIKPGAGCLHAPIMQLGMPPGMLVGAVKRGEHIFTPRGNDVLEAGDTVLVIQQRRNRQQANALFLHVPTAEEPTVHEEIMAGPGASAAGGSGR